MLVETQVPLAPLTTLRLGGSAARFVTVSSESELVEALDEASRANDPVLILGGGSNLVVADEGWPGLVVRIALTGVDAEHRGEHHQVSVGAGVPWDDFVAQCIDESWLGVECLAGIPGLVGATPIQNVGAYGQEVADTIIEIRVYDRQSREIVEIPREECEFAYRSSRFRRTDRYVVTGVKLDFARDRLSMPVRYGELARALGVEPGVRVDLRRVRETVISLRRQKGMVVDPADPETVSAGSFFVNPILDGDAWLALVVRARELGHVGRTGAPPGHSDDKGRTKVAAAWLIEQAGFVKGTSRGGVGVSQKHALALVNRGGTTKELLALESAIRAAVWDTFGVALEREPILATPEH